MTTPEYQPPAWASPAGPPQYPPPPYPGGLPPGGYPPPPYPGQPSYPSQPSYPTQPAAYPPPQPGYPPYPPQQPEPYPPAYPQQPGYQPEPPTNLMAPPSMYPSGSAYPPASAPPEQSQPSEPPKKGIRAKLAGIIGGILALALVAALKFGAGAAIQSVFGDDGPSRPSNPFDGTAAADYARGEAGIEVPTATEVPGFTEAEVAAALETVRQALVAGRLDERMLYDHDRSTLRALFSPFGAEDLDLMFDEKLGGIVATMIAPGYTLTDDPIRVSGTMTFTGTTIEGIRMLEVNTKYVWVYPFTGELKEPGDHLVTLKDDLYWMFPVPAEVDAEFVGMYLDGRSSSFAYNIDCDLLDQDLVALGKPQYGIGGEDIDPDDVMDPNSTTDLPNTC